MCVTIALMHLPQIYFAHAKVHARCEVLAMPYDMIAIVRLAISLAF